MSQHFWELRRAGLRSGNQDLNEAQLVGIVWTRDLGIFELRDYLKNFWLLDPRA